MIVYVNNCWTLSMQEVVSVAWGSNFSNKDKYCVLASVLFGCNNGIWANNWAKAKSSFSSIKLDMKPGKEKKSVILIKNIELENPRIDEYFCNA